MKKNIFKSIINKRYLDINYLKKIKKSTEIQKFQKVFILDDFLDKKFFSCFIKSFRNTNILKIHKIKWLANQVLYDYESEYLEEFKKWLYNKNFLAIISFLLDMKVDFNYKWLNNWFFVSQDFWYWDRFLDWHNHYWSNRQSDRVANILFYLNENYNKINGWELGLWYFDSNWNIIEYKRLEPLWNRLVILVDNEKYYHKVYTSNLNFIRKSLILEVIKHNEK